MSEDNARRTPPEPLLQVIANLTRFHREHEQFYSRSPLRRAGDLQAHSRALKSLADRWTEAVAGEASAASPFAGAEDLSAAGPVAASGILFMDGEGEGEGEPAELLRLKRELAVLADDSEQTGRGRRTRWSRHGRWPGS
ncbi:hypothetical protein [Streptomyces sp. GC420]|uniref:hypothetical protein n=1 Tax=Streptomyces sp. GC420 TaxID=2697568 RepID=UPI001FB588A9|nr:hypothetical protein [Streptomyces sp. GC420]